MCSFGKNVCHGLFLKLPFASLFHLAKIVSAKKFSIDVPSLKWSAGRLVKSCSELLKHVKDNFMLHCNVLFL